MRNLKIEVPCVVYPRRTARIDSSLRRKIGHDLFYFSSAQAMKVFDRNPTRYVKKLSDPITITRFPLTSATPRVVHRERTYYFASDLNRRTFEADREKYRDRRASAPVMDER